MAQVLVQIWTGPRCAADAVPRGPLVAVQSMTLTDARGGTEGGTLRVAASELRAVGAIQGDVARLILPSRGVSEWVVERITDDASGDRADLTLVPLRQLLALRGLVRTITDSGVTLAFAPTPATVTALLTDYVLANAAVDGLTWLSVGTVEYTGRISLPAFAGATRTQLLTAIEKATGYDVVLRRLANDAGYAIDVLAERGSDAPVRLVERPASAVSIDRVRAFSESATVLVPLNGGRGMGEVAWVGGAATGTGPFWVPLTAPNGGLPPIVEDGQFVNAYAMFSSGSPQLILNSRASDSAIQVAATPGHTTGSTVVLWETEQARPISAIASPSAVATRGALTGVVPVAGMRPERNVIANGDFADALTSWTDVNTALPAVYSASDFGVTITGALNGARSAGTGTGTTLPVDGLPANQWIRRGDQLVIEGTTYTVTADAIPTTSGALTLSISPTLVSALSNNTRVTLKRAEARTLTLTSGQSVGSPLLVVTDSNTDNLLDLAGTFTHDGSTTDTARPLFVNDILAGVALLDVSIAGQTLTDSYYGQTSMSGAGAVELPSPGGAPDGSGKLRFGDPTALGIVVGSRILAPVRHGVPGLPGGTWPCWLYEVTAIGDVLGTPGYCTLTPDTLGGRVTAENIQTTATRGTWLLYNGTYDHTATGTWSLARETRTLLASGTQSAGASSLTFQADSNIARRDWLSTDTITVERRVVDTVMAWTACTVTTGGGGYVITLTLDTTTSTVDNLPSSDYTGDNAGLARFQIPGAGAARTMTLVSITSGTAVLNSVNGEVVGLAASGSVTASWTAYYDHTLSSDASWVAAGTASLSISTVATGVSYARGARVWSNWHTRADHGRATCLRLSAAVSSGATSCSVYGNDRFRSTDEPTAARPIGLYRVFATHSTMPIPGETLDVATSVQANGSGAASLTLRAANATDLSDNTPFTITRPDLLQGLVRDSDAVVRLFYAPGSGTPSTSVPALQSSSTRIVVPPGETRTLIAKAWFVMTPGTLTTGQAPAIAIYSATGSTMLGYGTQTTSSVTYSETPSLVSVTATATIASTQTVAVRLFGGSSSTFSLWHVATEALLVVGTDPNISFFKDSGSLSGWQRASALLAERVEGARYQVTALDAGAFADEADRFTVGQRIRLRDPGMDLDSEVRILRLTWQWPGREVVGLECGALTPRFSDV